MNQEHMRRRCPQTVFLGKALLPGYRLAFRYRSTSFPGGGAADIIEDKQSSLWGVLYRSNTKDLVKLDHYEDVASGGYRRIYLPLLYLGQEVKSLSYEVVDKLPDDFLPTKEYAAILLRGAEQASLPRAYLDQLKQILGDR